MPTKRKRTRKNKQWQRAKWEGFVNVYLNPQEKRQIAENLLNPDECFQFFLDAATAGFKVSLSYSPPEGVHTVSLTGAYQGMPNAGKTMSIRHKEIEKAVSAVAWCMEQDGEMIDWEERFGNDSADDW